jgi:hypothetical protein
LSGELVLTALYDSDTSFDKLPQSAGLGLEEYPHENFSFVNSKVGKKSLSAPPCHATV